MTAARSAASRPLREDHLGASTFVEKGWNHIARGEFPEAEKALETALLLAPSDRRARSLFGWAQMRQGKLDQALQTLNRVLAEEPMNGLARASLGYVCLRKGFHREAQEHLTRAARQARDPKAALYGHFYLGMLQTDLRNVVDAEECFRKAIALAPNFIEAYYELGRLLFLSGETSKAQAAWRAGVSANSFSVWGRRCADALKHSEPGQEPRRYS